VPEQETLDLIELLLTAKIFNSEECLGVDDLPPGIRKNYWDTKVRGIKRPLRVTSSDVQKVFSHSPDARQDSLPFVEFDDFGSLYKLTVLDVATNWFVKQGGKKRIEQNPVLAYFYQSFDGLDVDYEEVKKKNVPAVHDREWIQGLIEEMEARGEEMQDALKLVHLRAPEDIVQKMDEIVLTNQQLAEIDKIIKAIQYRDYLREVGLRDIGKLLFVGPPGTGKTTTARAMSERLKLPFVEVRLSIVVSQYLGETSKNIDKVFELGKELAPCILFIDEFDFVAKTRTSDEHAAIKRAVNTLLKNIDEISLVNDGVLLIAATNHPQLLDTAAWRRFDEIMSFPLPDARMRGEIFSLVLARISGDFDFDELARVTDGLSGSDIRLVVREAVLTALTEDRKELTQVEMVAAAKNFSRRMKARTMQDL